MSDVNETLQDLMERRLRELGKRRGRGESISLREAYQRLLETISNRNMEAASEGRDEDGGVPPTYEVFRRIRNGHTNISADTASALATMLDVPLADVYKARGIRAPLGPFKLPKRAERLGESERAVVLAVVDAILNASDNGVDNEALPALRAVAQDGDPEDAEKVTELARKARRRQTGQDKS